MYCLFDGKIEHKSDFETDLYRVMYNQMKEVFCVSQEDSEDEPGFPTNIEIDKRTS